MLLDPLEKQFDLPAAAVQFGDCSGRQTGVVGQEYQRLSVHILDADASDRGRIMLRGIEPCKHADLIANNAFAPVCGTGIASSESKIRFGSYHKETASLMKGVQSLEIEIPTIHDVERPRLRDKHVEDIHFVPLAVRNMDETGYIAAKVQQGMHLYSRLGRAKGRPGENRKAQVDGRGIECVNCFRQIHTKRFVQIEFARDADQALGKIGINAPISNRIGVGQRIARYRGAESHVVKLRGLTAQAGFDIAETFAVGQLGEGHAQELIEAGKLLYLVFPSIAGNAAAKRGQRKVRHELRKYELAGIHGKGSPSSLEKTICYLPVSNRDQSKLPNIHTHSTRYHVSFV